MSATDAPRVLWFFGADAVGKSTIGWAAYEILAEAGRPVAYLDTDYLGFCTPSPDDPGALVADNLAALWPSFAARGIDQLVVSGIVVTAADQRRFEAAIPDASFMYCLLTAEAEAQRRRILGRREAEVATLDVRLDPAERAELEAYAERSVGFGARLATSGLADVTLATDDRSPQDLAGEAVERLLPPG